MSHPYDNSQDQELLRAWEQCRDDAAFRELVERHLGMVHATALRRTGCAEMARDVSMGVFALLARRAASVCRHPCLAGWLHRAAFLEASNALRREIKHSRIMAALSDPALATSETGEVNALLEMAAPHLDGVLERLSQGDRDAVLMRYTERLSYEAMSARLGKSADACQKQTSRALEKLATLLLRRGVALSAAVAGSVITAATAKAAPALLAGKIAAGAAQKAAGVSILTIIHHTLHAMNTGKQIASGILLAAALAALPLLIQQSEASALSLQAEARPVVRQETAPAATNAPKQKSPPDYTRVHPPAGAAEAEATLRMIAALDGRQFTTHELFDLASRLLDLPVEYMPRALERILAMKTTLLQPALGVALFSRWGELDPEGATAMMKDPSFTKLHPYAKEIAETGIHMGMLESDPRALLKSPGNLDMDFLASGLPNMEPELAKEFLARVAPWKRAEAELTLLFRNDPDNFEAAAKGLMEGIRSARAEGNNAYMVAQKAVNLLAERDPQRALAFALSLQGDGREYRAATDIAMRRWTERDAPAAMAWVNTQSAESQRMLFWGLSPALEKMDAEALRGFISTGPEDLQPDRFLVGALSLANRDPAAAARLAEEAPARTRAWAWDSIAHTWAESDKVQASEWIDGLPAGADRNTAIAGFSRHLVWEDAESALIWAASISDPAMRAKVVESRIQAWLSTDRPAARAWLEKSGVLSAEQEQALLSKPPHELKLEH